MRSQSTTIIYVIYGFRLRETLFTWWYFVWSDSSHAFATEIEFLNPMNIAILKTHTLNIANTFNYIIEINMRIELSENWHFDAFNCDNLNDLLLLLLLFCVLVPFFLSLIRRII